MESLDRTEDIEADVTHFPDDPVRDEALLLYSHHARGQRHPAESTRASRSGITPVHERLQLSLRHRRRFLEDVEPTVNGMVVDERDHCWPIRPIHHDANGLSKSFRDNRRESQELRCFLHVGNHYLVDEWMPPGERKVLDIRWSRSSSLTCSEKSCA
jgi:hypothetical protein